MTRVPFALLGVVLLVGSTTLVGTLGGPAVSEPTVERAMDRASAETQTALREAAISAAHEAASDPVTARADTPYGRVLNESTPFRDALRVRLYVSARERLGDISRKRNGVRVRATLPPVESPEDLRTAKRRIRIERFGPDGTAMRVHVEGVRLVASRDGRVVGTETVSPTLVVPAPTLAVHDRVERFENRLNAGPLRPGLGRRLTARLYPVVWARGYAQYGGAPIENVLANRHVALFTNGGMLALQREFFGESDPAGRYVHRRALAETALTDLLAGTDHPTADWLREAHEEVGLTPKPSDALATADVEPSVDPDDPVTVGINGTADRAFLGSEAALTETLRETYSARVRLRHRVRHLGTEQVREPQLPGPGWGVVDSTTRTRVRVAGGDPDPPGPTPETGTHVLDVYGRTVVRTHTTVYRLMGPEGRKTIAVGQRVERSLVTFTLVGEHTRGRAPVGPIATVHERGGPLDGPNLADVQRLAYDRLVADRGGLDRLAERAIEGGGVGTTAVVYAGRPAGLAEWVYRDLARLRERVADISMTTTRADIATLRSNPPATLAAKLRERRAELIGAPETYPNVAQRARVAARTEYVDRLIRRLEGRADDRSDHRAQLRERLSDRSRAGDPIERLQLGYQRRDERDVPEPLDGLRTRVDAEPAYLTRRAVESGTVGPIARGATEHPLVARNWNVMTLPYGDVVDALVSAILGPETTRLRTGAQVLRTVERTNDSAHDVDTDRLKRDVRDGTQLGLGAGQETLAEFGLGDRSSRRAVIARAMDRWETTGTRALAVANGSAAAAIHEAATARWSGSLTDRERDLLALRLREDVHEAVTSKQARPAEPTVDDASRAFRAAMRNGIASEMEDSVAEAGTATASDLAGRSLGRLPAGMPVAPAPGFWYATVNLWRVEVAGEYARFTVRVPRGTPDDPGAQLHYVREEGTVTLDIDGDGTGERLGRTTRVSFRTGTEVAIAVPPGPQGVGDVDGQAREESPGWPEPGP
jgi:hypothetical protein